MVKQNNTVKSEKQADSSTESDLVPKKNGGKKAFIALLVVLLAVLPALGMYYYQSNSAKKQQAELQKQIDELKKEKADLETAAKKAKAAKDTALAPTTTCPASLTATQLENVHASIESMNTAALDQLMTDNVQFVVAASSKGGTETKAAAISDLSYLSSATAPWNWNIAAATLNGYKASSYSTYLADDTIFGAAANKYFVSMRVTCGKIDQVFVAASTDLLQ